MKKLPLISVPDFLARFPQAAHRGRRAQSAAAMECIGRPHRQNEAGRHPQQPALCRSPGLGTSSPGKNSDNATQDAATACAINRNESGLLRPIFALSSQEGCTGECVAAGAVELAIFSDVPERTSRVRRSAHIPMLSPRFRPRAMKSANAANARGQDPFGSDLLPRNHALGTLARQLETSDAAKPI